MSNRSSTGRGAVTQRHDILLAGEQLGRDNLNNTTLASTTSGGFFPAARNFSISGSQFTEVHGNVCNCCLGLKNP